MIAATFDMAPRQAAGRRTFALIAALLCLPFVVATLLWASGWRPERQINHGELLLADHLPVRQLIVHNFQKNGRDAAGPPQGGAAPSGGASAASRGPSLPAAGPSQGGASPLEGASEASRGASPHAAPGHPTLFDGRWMLALAVPGECGADCVAQLALARQVQVSLNKDMVRLARGLVGPQLHDTTAHAARWPDLAIGHADDVAWRTLGGERITAPQLFLIDPQGRLVLRYTAAPDPKGVRRDVERLLKYSWNG